MPLDQSNLPEWNSVGTEPPKSKKDSGFEPGDKPPADWFNWLFNKIFKSLQNLFAYAQDKSEKGKPNGYAGLDENGKVIEEQLNLDTSSLATKQEFDDLKQSQESHQAEKASLTEAGHVQLSSSTNSESELLAATPKAVKIAMDRADAAFTLGNSRKQELVDKLLLLDPSLPISYESTWEEILTTTGTVSTGKKWASGTVSPSSSGVSFTDGSGASVSRNYVTVTGLTFLPSIIILKNDETATRGALTLYDSGKIFPGANVTIHMSNTFNTTYTGATIQGFQATGNAFINKTSFQLPIMSNNYGDFTWIAFE